MILNKKVVVVMPAYNAQETLEKTLNEVDRSIVDDIVLVDDCSKDRTAELARKLGLTVIQHDRNRGYGGNQKTCYQTALALNADIVVMVHPDYQYTPKLIPALVGMLVHDVYDLALGSRILGGTALQGGMPLYKYVANRFLTFAQNVMTGLKMSEYHTGYRAFTRKVLESLPLDRNSDDFVFDNQMLLQAAHAGFRIGEISCPAKYFPGASSINLRRSTIYGFSCLWTSLQLLLTRFGIVSFPIFRFEPLNLHAHEDTA